MIVMRDGDYSRFEGDVGVMGKTMCVIGVCDDNDWRDLISSGVARSRCCSASCKSFGALRTQ